MEQLRGTTPTMMLSVLLLLVLCHRGEARQSVMDYCKQFEGVVDFGAAKACYLLFGTLAPVDVNNLPKGFTCKYTRHSWTANDKDAHEYCSSRNPYHIRSAKSIKTSGQAKTDCEYQINLMCKPDWYQINNVCYKAYDGKYTYAAAKKMCEGMEAKEAKPQLAEYYSSSLALYFSDMLFVDGWVTVPHIKEYFVNGKGDGAVFVLDGAHKYDTKPGSLILDHINQGHGAICQYSPGMTMAEVFYTAEIYSEIYPVILTPDGPNIATSSYVSIEQSGTSGGGGQIFEKFTTQPMRDRCTNIGNILNVHSFPLVSIDLQFEVVKDKLTDHRFYMTSAYKNDGCKMSDYKDHDSNTGMDVAVYAANQGKTICDAFSLVFSSHNRHPAPAAFRAPLLCTLHSFSYEYGDCPNDWHTVIRSNGTKFCHYINNDHLVNYATARKECADMGASLSGFESKAEYMAISPYIAIAGHWHYYLGGVIPCRVDCKTGYMASWDEGVSRNTDFLNGFNHEGWDWTDVNTEIITYRADLQAFHTHDRYFYGVMWYICGKYPSMVPSKKTSATVKNTGP